MNRDRLFYKGSVKVKIKINNKYYTVYNHNSGTEYLQKSFCKFLTGNYGGEPDIPQLIDLRRQDPTYSQWTTCLNQEIGLTGKTYLKTTDAELGLNDVWVARFTAAIPYSTLIANVTEGFTNFRLYLYGSFDGDDSSERYHDLAYIDISKETVEKITPGTQALIEWSMQLLNYDEPVATADI